MITAQDLAELLDRQADLEAADSDCKGDGRMPFRSGFFKAHLKDALEASPARYRNKKAKEAAERIAFLTSK